MGGQPLRCNVLAKNLSNVALAFKFGNPALHDVAAIAALSPHNAVGARWMTEPFVKVTTITALEEPQPELSLRTATATSPSAPAQESLTSPEYIHVNLYPTSGILLLHGTAESAFMRIIGPPCRVHRLRTF